MEADARFWAGRTVCVTGGTGLLGWNLVQALLSAGASVRVLALPTHARHEIHRRPGVEAIFGDVRDAEIARRAVADSSVVFHCAGVVGDWGPILDRMMSVHRDGTRTVIEAAGAAGARVVHTSSIVTVGASRGPEVLDEDAPFRLDRLGVDYIHAKRAAEQVALEAARDGGDVVVVNPAYLIGPGDFERSVMGQFCKRFWRGQVLFAPPGGFNLVDVRDVALGHMLAAERGEPGRRYILAGENRTFPELMAMLAEVGGLRPRSTLRAPWPLLATMSAATELRARLNGRQPYPSWQSTLLNRYYWFYKSTRAWIELGFAPRGLHECLQDTHAWFSRHSKMLVRGAVRWWVRPAEPAIRGSHPPAGTQAAPELALKAGAGRGHDSGPNRRPDQQ